MKWMARLRFFLRWSLRRKGIEDELNNELQDFIERSAADQESHGLSSTEARRRARIDLGGVVQNQERVREGSPWAFFDSVLKDVRFAGRNLLKTPGFTAVAVVTLALGIGASTAIISVVDAALLRPLPYPDPEQLVAIYTEVDQPDGSTSLPTPSMADMRVWQEAEVVLSQVAGWGTAFNGRIVEGPEPARISVVHLTEDYLTMHGVAPIIGRGFTRDDLESEAEPVAMLGHGYWQSRFGGRADVINETVRLDDGIATIVGVLPAGFHSDTPLFRPLTFSTDQLIMRGTGRLSVYGRLRPGVTLERAAAELSRRMSPTDDGRGVRAQVRSRFEQTTSRYNTSVNILMGAGGLLLLIACVNVAGLLLARGTARQPELATRASLGAGRARLVRQLLTESFVLAAIGGIVGVAMAWLALDVIVAMLPIAVPDDASVRVDLRVLAATIVLLFPTTLVFGLIPSVRLSRADLSGKLAHGFRPAASAPLSRRNNQFLIGAELALAVVLVVGAGLMIRTYAELSAVDLGFEPEGMLTMQVLPLGSDPAVHDAYYPELIARIQTIPGVESAGAVDNFALAGATRYSSVRVGEASTPVTVFGAVPGYFDAIRARLVDGAFPTDDDHARDTGAAVISRTAAERIFPDVRAVGRQFTYGRAEPYFVVGVIEDLRHGGPLESDAERVAAQVYVPFDTDEFDIQLNRPGMIVLRTEGDVRGLGVTLREAAQSIGPPVLVESIRTADDWFGDRVRTPRQRTILLVLMAGLGLVLALVGVFGMTAYTVARRIPEIGVRMAFGARPAQVVGTILRDAVFAIIIGTLLGLVGARMSSRVIDSFLFEVEPSDPATFVAVAIVLSGAAFLAAFIPAVRASRVDPSKTLRV